MKTEILVAIGVLACSVAATQLVASRQNDPQPASKSTQIAQVQPASYHANESYQGETQRIASISGSPVLPAADFETDINELIRNAADALANSPPLQAKLRYKIQLFGEDISGPGRYFQKGQGTRLTRMELEFGFDKTSVQLHQFCDGDKLYTLSIAGEKSRLEYVDLRQLDSLQQRTESSSRVANWLSVGSLTGLMEQLSSHFVFTEATESMLDTIPVVECTGQWNPSALKRLLEGQNGAEAINDDVVNWQELPGHLPHQVRLTLGMDQRFPYFPYRIVFEQFKLENGQQVLNEVAVLELYELRHAWDLTDEMFNLPNIDAKQEDSTEFYKQRILQFTR